MRRLLGLLAALAMLQIAAPALAQSGTPAQAQTSCSSINNSPVAGNYYSVITDLNRLLCVNISGGSIVVAGAQSNAGAGTTGSTNVPVMGYNYYWTGSAWAQWTGTVSGSNVGGYDSGPISTTCTPANSSHAAGVAVCGLQSVPVARVTGGAGTSTQFALTSSGGFTGSYVVRIWSKQPTNTTCTDNTSFAGNFTTDDAYLVTPPFIVSPIAPSVTTGDANTYGVLTNLNLNTKRGRNAVTKCLMSAYRLR